MNDITKLELFAAYLPYKIGLALKTGVFACDHFLSELDYNDEDLGGFLLKLRPLEALQTPMLHPVTGERIENPAEWIAWKSGANDSDVIAQVKGNLVINDQTDIIRAIDRLALELHFDVFGAIEKGWAVQI